MYRLSLWFVILALHIGGCVKPVPPVFEDPVPMSLPSAPGSLGPRLTGGDDQPVLLSWMEHQDDGGLLRVSALGPDGWLPASNIVSDPKMFVNWADFPSVTSMGGDRWVAHWLRYSANEVYSYDTIYVQSKDNGKSWSEPMTPHTDGTATEHGFVSIWPGDTSSNGAVGLIWLDGRKTKNAVSDDAGANDHSSNGMTLRAAFIDANGTRSGEQQIDDLVCDCCQTDVAVSSLGPIAVYRDRTPAEIRDISLSRFVDGQWQEPEAFSSDNWEISGCPVNGPAIAASGKLVAVAWFTAARDSPIVKMRLSKDGGRQFGDPIIVDTGDLLGYVDVAYIGDSSFAVSWVRDGEDLHTIRVRSVTSAGELGRIKTVGRTAVSRNVPQMVKHQGDLIFAWTDSQDDASRVAGVSVEIVLAK